LRGERREERKGDVLPEGWIEEVKRECLSSGVENNFFNKSKADSSPIA